LLPEIFDSSLNPDLKVLICSYNREISRPIEMQKIIFLF
jgi:hypothetical protein